jgi:caa(3)-type oxidase subunit IV
MNERRRIDAVAIVLVVGTLVSAWLGEGQPGTLPRALAAVVLLLALVKGTLVALDFMELKSAPPLWRRAVLGWLVGVVLLIVLAWS